MTIVRPSSTPTQPRPAPSLRSDFEALLGGNLAPLSTRWNELWKAIEGGGEGRDKAVVELASLVESLAGKGGTQTSAGLDKSLARLRDAQNHWKEADFKPVGVAARSFADPTLSPLHRRDLLETAMGPELNTSVHHAIRAGSSLLPPGTVGKVAGESLGRKIDSRLRQLEQPYAELDVANKLDLVRLLVSAEMDSLSKVGVRVLPGKEAELRGVCIDHVRKLTTLCLEHSMSPKQRDELSASIGKVVDAALEPFQSEGASLWDSASEAGTRLSEAVADLPDVQNVVGSIVSNLQEQATDPTTYDRDSDVRQGVHALHLELLEQLAPLVELGPGSAEALGELGQDLAALGNYVHYSAKLFVAIKAEDLEPAERSRRVRTAAEGLGPLFIKLIQTLMTFEPLVQSLANSGKESIELPALDGLLALQDQATPMAEAAVRAEVKRSLGKDIEQAFVSFDIEPIAAASIGQVHRAVIEVPGPTPWSKPQQVTVAVKIRRDDLDASFDRDVRVARMLVAVGRESADSLASNPAHRDYVHAGFALLEGSINVLVDSFRAEKNFPAEVGKMKSFARKLSATAGVVVPRVYDSHCGEGVITMQYVTGEKLKTFIARHVVATEARANPLQTSDIEGLSSEEAAKVRARHWGKEAYGLEATDIVLERSPKGEWVATLSFDNKVHPGGTVKPKDDGTVSTKDKLPDLSVENIQSIQRRLLAMFSTQGMNGEMHGDMHGGNLQVMGDGHMLALLDFGQTVDFADGQMKAPLTFGKGLISSALPESSSDPQGVVMKSAGRVGDHFRNKAVPNLAEAIVDMSEKRLHLSRSEREAVIEKLIAAIPEEAQRMSALATEDGSALASPSNSATLALAAVVCSLKEDLFPTPDYFHALKSSIAMAGNIVGLNAVARPKRDEFAEPLSAVQLGKQAAGHVVGVVGEVAAERLRKASGLGLLMKPAKTRRASKLSR